MEYLFKKEKDYIKCLLCPHNCKIKEGNTGICRVRKNGGDKIELLTYGVLSAYSSDPVEKKPLYHYFPGHNILSVGSYGCNMRCDYCQNYNISQNIPDILDKKTTPEELVKNALLTDMNIGIAFTYNEPVIWFEFIKDTSIIAKKEGLFTAMVSNGYVNREPLLELIQFIDAFNIDLKAFNNNFYRKLSNADIQPVKNALKLISKSGKHLEITTLIIPGQNDNKKEMALQSEWIAGELGKDVPLHLSRYFPMFRRNDPSTSQETLMNLFEIASKNLDFVYVGNTVSEYGQTTFCPVCKTSVTERSGYRTRFQNIDKEGKCIKCGTLIYKNFTFSSSSEN